MAVKMEGPLTKWTNVVQGWQYRWFVLDEHTGLLSYYTVRWLLSPLPYFYVFISFFCIYRFEVM